MSSFGRDAVPGSPLFIGETDPHQLRLLRPRWPGPLSVKKDSTCHRISPLEPQRSFRQLFQPFSLRCTGYLIERFHLKDSCLFSRPTTSFSRWYASRLETVVGRLHQQDRPAETELLARCGVAPPADPSTTLRSGYAYLPDCATPPDEITGGLPPNSQVSPGGVLNSTRTWVGRSTLCGYSDVLRK
jgi:hypothetical protein